MNSFFEFDGQIIANISAAAGPLTPPAAATRTKAKTATENFLEDVTDVGESATRGPVAAPACCARNAGMTKAIISRPLLGIAQHLIGFIDLLDAHIRIRVVVDVGVILFD